MRKVKNLLLTLLAIVALIGMYIIYIPRATFKVLFDVDEFEDFYDSIMGFVMDLRTKIEK